MVILYLKLEAELCHILSEDAVIRKWLYWNFRFNYYQYLNISYEKKRMK